MKRKIICLMMSMILTGSLSFSLTGCDGENVGNIGSKVETDSDGQGVNKKYDENSLVSLSGEKINLKDNDKVVMCKTSGFGFLKSSKWDEISNQDGIDGYSEDPEAYYMMYMPEEQAKKMKSIDKATMSKEEISAIKKEAYASEFYAFAIYRINEDDEETAKDGEELVKDFKNNEKIGEVGKDTFYFAYNDTVPEEGFSDSDKEDIKKMIDTIEEVKKSIMIFPPTDPMDDFKASMEEFTTTDLDGNEVNADIFKDYDVTMVNVWATWCKYCIQEMPDLEKVYENLPDKTNIISICEDGDTEAEAAKEILDKAGAKFKALKSCDEISDNVLEYVKGYPTTFFVDKNGKVIGKLQIGTPTDGGDNAAAYKQLLEEVLEEQTK